MGWGKGGSTNKASIANDGSPKVGAIGVQATGYVGEVVTYVADAETTPYTVDLTATAAACHVELSTGIWMITGFLRMKSSTSGISKSAYFSAGEAREDGFIDMTYGTGYFNLSPPVRVYSLTEPTTINMLVCCGSTDSIRFYRRSMTATRIA